MDNEVNTPNPIKRFLLTHVISPTIKKLAALALTTALLACIGLFIANKTYTVPYGAGWNYTTKKVCPADTYADLTFPLIDGKLHIASNQPLTKLHSNDQIPSNRFKLEKNGSYQLKTLRNEILKIDILDIDSTKRVIKFQYSTSS